MLFENSVSQWLHFLKRRCSYLKCGEIEGEGERGFSLLTHFPNACNGWGWATLKPGDRTSSGSSSGWQRYKHWGHILLLSQWWAGSWTASGAGGTWTSVYVGCWCYRGQLHTLCHNTSPSENTYSREVKKCMSISISLLLFSSSCKTIGKYIWWSQVVNCISVCEESFFF